MSSGRCFLFLPETLITITIFSLDLLDSNIPLVVSVMKLTITGYSATFPLWLFITRGFFRVVIRAWP